MADVTEADIVAAKWRHGPTCQYHSFNNNQCTCDAEQAFASLFLSLIGVVLSL